MPLEDYADFSATELFARIRRPTTPLEILTNIKFVMDHDLLLKEDFITEQRIKHLFGAEKVEEPVRWKGSPSNFDARGYNVSGFDSMMTSLVMRDKGRAGFHFGVNQIKGNGAFIEGSLHWMNEWGEPALVYENLTSILGMPTSAGFRPVTHQNMMSLPKWVEKTHVHGRDIVIYEMSAPLTERSIAMRLFPDGTLDIGYFRVRPRIH